MRYPTSFQQKTLWNAATGLAILIIGILTVGLIWLLGRVFGFLQPVLIPLIVAGIVAYVLDPVVRLLEKRGLSRLWSVVSVFAGILLGTTLLVAAVVPGIQRGHGTLKSLLKSPVQAVSGGGKRAADPDTDRLGSVLARELSAIRDHHRHNPIGWLLTETDDDGEPLPITGTADVARTVGQFRAKPRGTDAV